jgi:S1-C subfamily serine protease
MTRLAPALLLAAVLTFAARAATNSPALDLARQLNNAFVEVAEAVSPSVVVIRVANKPGKLPFDDDDNPFWDLLPKGMPEEFRRHYKDELDKRRKEAEEEAKSSPPKFDGKGSGVIVQEDGYILTNFHVVEDATRIEVRLRDRRRFTATLHGKDPQSDLAVLKINATNLPAARFGDSDAVRVGEFAVAIGAPFEFDYSVTFGHISAKGRSQVIPARGQQLQGATMDQDFLQTDASINPGNSGGPLVNLYGEVIGINTLIRGLRTGIGFAVPVNLAKIVSEKLIKDGKFPRLWLGLEIRGLREDDEAEEKVDGVEDGVLVTFIRADGPASKSDLRTGDVITSVDGRSVVTSAQLRNEVRRKKAGSPVTLEIIRKSKPMKIKVSPEEWPEAKGTKEKGE